MAGGAQGEQQGPQGKESWGEMMGSLVPSPLPPYPSPPTPSPHPLVRLLEQEDKEVKEKWHLTTQEDSKQTVRRDAERTSAQPPASTPPHLPLNLSAGWGLFSDASVERGQFSSNSADVMFTCPSASICPQGSNRLGATIIRTAARHVLVCCGWIHV